MRLPAIAATLAFVALAFAGCSGSSTPTTDPFNLSRAGGPHGANVTVDALPWRVGESWDHHWFIGKNDTAGFVVRTVVAENRTTGVLVAAANATDAAFHGAFLFPTFGVFPRTNVAADVGTNHWPWYRFPLANATWTDTLVSRGGSGEAYTLPVTVVQKSTGHRSFAVEMRTAGKLVATYDYDAKTHWFSEMRVYDTAKDSTPDQWVARIVSEAHAYDYTGPYFDDTGDVLLQFQNVQVPGVVPTPSASFTMTADQNKLLMIRVTFAADGAQETTVLDPNMDPATKAIYHQEAYGASSQSVSTDLFHGIPGTWQVVSTGGGVATGSIVFAYGIHERAGSL
ncbi:MAG: hypothetical protein V4510_04990 [bacterium]